MSGNYKVKIKDIQNKYKFKIFCASNYDDSELKKMYEAIYMALPKETATGTSNTLNDTAKSFMKNELNATESSQDTTTGKQLLEYPYYETSKSLNGVTFTANQDGSVLVNGTPTGVTYIILENKMSIQPNTEYTLSGIDESYNLVFYIAEYNSNDEEVSHRDNVQGTYTFTTTNTTSKILVQLKRKNNNVAINNITIYPQLELGSSATSWEKYTGKKASPNPDYPQDIHTINGDNTIISSGKNLFDKNNAQYLVGYIDTNTIVSYSTYRTIYIKCKPNTKYSISRGLGTSQIYMAYTNTTPILNGSCYGKITGTTITTGNDAEYLLAQVYRSNTDTNTFEEILGSIMINEGETALPYEPYKSNSVLLTLGDKEICKIGNYEDKIFKAIKGNEIYDSLSVEEKNTLDYGKWYLQKNIGKQVFNGSESWHYDSGNEMFVIYGTGVNYVKRGLALSDKYLFNATTLNDLNFNIGNNNFIDFKNSNYTTESSWKTALQSEPITAYWQLATPINEKFNDIIQEQLEDIYYNMLSYEGQTNVSQVNNDLPFNINSNALKDLSDL